MNTITVAAAPKRFAGAPAVAMSPAFMRVSTNEMAKLVMRASPFFAGGQWRSAEYALLGAVVASWFGDVIGLAREQWRRAHRIEPAYFARLLDGERKVVNAYAAMLGISSTWIDAALRDLDLEALG